MRVNAANNGTITREPPEKGSGKWGTGHKGKRVTSPPLSEVLEDDAECEDDVEREGVRSVP